MCREVFSLTEVALTSVVLGDLVSRPIAQQPERNNAAAIGSTVPTSPGAPRPSAASQEPSSRFSAEDTVDISGEARSPLARNDSAAPSQPAGGVLENNIATNSAEDAREEERVEQDSSSELSPGELTESEQDLVDRLEARDAEVRRHEQAHLVAAGSLANGPPKYDYQRGPDGRNYAVGGSVSIDVSEEADPEATIAKAEQIKRAALAPAEPSGKDRQIAARADAMKLEAQQELAQERRDAAAEIASATTAQGSEASLPASGAINPGDTGPGSAAKVSALGEGPSEPISYRAPQSTGSIGIALNLFA